MHPPAAPLSCAAALLAGVLAAATPAVAHIRLDFPSGRSDDDSTKVGPCGKGADDARGTKIGTFEPGATLTVRFTETIDHAGFYRVAFDDDGADAADFDAASNELGRLDDPHEPSGLEKTIDVVLPDVECDACTLQLTQDMGGSTYFQCADLVLERGGGNTEDTGAVPVGCSGTGRTPLVWAAALLLWGEPRRTRAVCGAGFRTDGEPSSTKPDPKRRGAPFKAHPFDRAPKPPVMLPRRHAASFQAPCETPGQEGARFASGVANVASNDVASNGIGQDDVGQDDVGQDDLGQGGRPAGGDHGRRSEIARVGSGRSVAGAGRCALAQARHQGPPRGGA